MSKRRWGAPEGGWGQQRGEVFNDGPLRPERCAGVGNGGGVKCGADVCVCVGGGLLG